MVVSFVLWENQHWFRSDRGPCIKHLELRQLEKNDKATEDSNKGTFEGKHTSLLFPGSSGPLLLGLGRAQMSGEA